MQNTTVKKHLFINIHLYTILHCLIYYSYMNCVVFYVVDFAGA